MMKKPTSIFICTLLLSVAVAQAQSVSQQNLYKNWKLYTVKGEPFSVALPVYPAMQTLIEKREKPEKNRQIRLLRASNNGVAYTIYVVDNRDAGRSLDDFIKEQTSNPTLDLTGPRDVTLDGIAGKSFVYPDGKGMVQFFATKNRFYDFRAQGAYLDDARITTFFYYLSLTKQDKSIEVFDGPGSFYENNPQDLYRSPDLDTKVRMHSKPEPDYSSVDVRISGTVILRCIFTSNGTITNFIVVQGLPGGGTEAAIKAARQIKFTPATKDGKAVSMWMQLEYRFSP